MGYNESYGPVRRMREYLDKLIEAEETVDFATEDPKSLAYKLREAIHAAQFWDQYEHYHEELSAMFEFQERPGLVRARYLGEGSPTISTDGKDEEETTKTTTPDLKTVTLQEVGTLNGVVGAAIKYEGQAQELQFPSAVLIKKEKQRLFKWSVENDWKIIDHEEGGITLTRRDVAEEITWKPQQEVDDG